MVSTRRADDRVEYEAKGFAVDARLAHFAIGYELALKTQA